MTEKELMLSEQLYIADDEELVRDYERAKAITRKINNPSEENEEYRRGLFKELFGSIGENFRIEPPFRTDYGQHIHIGKNFFANYDCIIIDVADVYIGDNVFFAPRVSLYTAGHPIDADVRNTQLEYGKKITIGDNVWIGGNVVVNPGVTIGSNVVIGSGSVVTYDIPDGVVAAGVPCRVIREITEEDSRYWRELEEKYHLNKKL